MKRCHVQSLNHRLRAETFSESLLAVQLCSFLIYQLKYLPLSFCIFACMCVCVCPRARVHVLNDELAHLQASSLYINFPSRTLPIQLCVKKKISHENLCHGGCLNMAHEWDTLLLCLYFLAWKAGRGSNQLMFHLCCLLHTYLSFTARPVGFPRMIIFSHKLTQVRSGAPESSPS